MINRQLARAFTALAIIAAPLDALPQETVPARTAADHVSDVLEAAPPLRVAAASVPNVMVYTELPLEKRDNPASIGAAFEDYADPAETPDIYKECKIYSLAREDNVLPALEQAFGFKIENIGAIDPKHLALWVFFHELRHCMQPDTMDISVRETDADLYGINMIKSYYPDSTIDRVVLAFRAISPLNTNPETSHANAVFLAAALKTGRARSNYSVASNVISYMMLDMTVYQSFVEIAPYIPPTAAKDEKEYLMFLSMVSLDRVIRNPAMGAMAELAQVRRDALEFLLPTLSGHARELADIWFPKPAPKEKPQVKSRLKPGVTVPAQP